MREDDQPVVPERPNTPSPVDGTHGRDAKRTKPTKEIVIDTSSRGDEPTRGEMRLLSNDEIRRKYPRWWGADVEREEGADDYALPSNGEVLALETDELKRKYPEWCSEHYPDAEDRPDRFLPWPAYSKIVDAYTSILDDADIDAVLGTLDMSPEFKDAVLSTLGAFDMSPEERERVTSILREIIDRESRIERVRDERNERWIKSIRAFRRSSHDVSGRPVTQKELCEYLRDHLLWPTRRLSDIEQDKKGRERLRVYELFELSDVFGVSPMRVIGEMTDDEERLLRYWRAMSDGQRDALLKWLGEFIPTTQDENS